MKPLIVLLSSFAVALAILVYTNGWESYPFAMRIGMACMFVFTAIGHFAFPKGMSAMLPDFFPAKTTLVYASGLLEFAFAFALLYDDYLTQTAWIIIAFFILTLPFNIKAARENLDYQTGKYDGPGLRYLWFRIPLQVVFIGWVYLAAFPC